MKWRDTDDEPPEDGQKCITKCKHGIIEGTYSAKDDYFEGYFAVSLSWGASRWIPSSEFWECFEG